MNQTNEQRPASVATTPKQAGDARAHERWAWVEHLLQAGHDWVVDADLKSYFDTIPHERLMALLQARVADGRVLTLVESFLRAGVLETAKGWRPTERGTPQGGVISPLLANVYLNPLDHQMEKAGWEMVCYADDFVILCRSEAEAQNALVAVRQWRLDGVGKGIGATHQRCPNEWFARRGLLSLAVEHEWTREIVGIRTH